MKVAKSHMDHSLEEKKYGRYSTLEVVFRGSLCVAATGAISPNFSIDGTELQSLTDTKTDSQVLAFGTDVSERGSSVVFLWSSEEEAPRDYVEEVLELSKAFLPQFLCQFFFTHCENTYFSPKWWSGLASQVREELARMMLNTNPYASPPLYLEHLDAVPWQYDSHAVL